MMQSAFRTFSAALLLAFPAIEVGAAEGTGLFSADGGAIPLRQAPKRLLEEDAFPEGGLGGEAAGDLIPSPELRSRIARIDLGQLEAARSEVARGRPSNLRLNLFTDADFQAVIERTAPTASGHTLTGRLADDPLSTAVLAVNGNLVAGTVWSLGGIHTIRGSASGVTIRQLDSGRLARCQGPAMLPPVREQIEDAPQEAKLPPLARGTSSQKASAADDDGTTIDLLVVYPSFIRRYQGGHLAMRTLIDQDVAMANAAFEVGGVDVRVALAAAVEVDYKPQEIVRRDGKYLFVNRGVRDEFWSPEAVLGTLLELGDPSDGQLDDIHALRDSYAADLVLMHWGDREELGLAYRPENLSSSYWEPWGFAVSASIPFTHEIGHNLGLMHDRANNPGNLPFPYSHGYVFDNPAGIRHTPQSYGTIMSVSGQYLHRFSDPNQHFPNAAGIPLGVPGDVPSERVDGPADAVRSLSQTRRMVANFRRSADRCEYRLSPEVSALPAAGGEFNIRVETAPGCTWSAHSPDGLAAPLMGASSRVGSGELTYSISVNNGWEREGVIFVAGEPHQVKQAGSRPITPVCERPPAIRRALSDALVKPNCTEFTAADLASVWFLQLDETEERHNEELRTLKRGDFDGLLNLYKLYVWNPGSWGRDADGIADGVIGLTSLEAGAFDGLSNLHTLLLQENSLKRLERGAFAELPNLRILHLGRNSLMDLAPDAFEGMPNLHTLELWNNRLKKLDPGTFAGLSNLQVLYLNGNNFVALNSSAFSGLSNLQVLNLQGNDLIAIELGAFAGLPNLKELILAENNLTQLDPDVFDELPNLTALRLWGNPLGNLRRGQFHALPNLRVLFLQDIGMQSLTSDVFEGLLQLESLHLSHNRLTTLKANAFDRLPNLDLVTLADNRLTGWGRGIFAGDRVSFGMDLSGNQIRTLPPGTFEGLKTLYTVELDLRGNPGAPFISRPELIRSYKASSVSNRSAEIAVEVAEGALMDMRIGLSISGGTLSAGEVFVAQGAIRGSAVRVTPSDAGPVTVRVASVPEFPTDPRCQFPVITGYCNRFFGIRMAAGAPLVLYGLPDQTLAADGSVRFDLPSAFLDFGEGTSYAVQSSNPAVVEALIREGLLIVSADGGGETTLTVTATGPDGRRETRRFTVTAPAAPEAVGSIPDLSLLVGESARIDLAGKFRDPDGGPLAYAAESDNAVAASVDGDAVQIAAKEPGVATVTLTATDPDGLSATLNFKVKVQQLVRSRWGGWRSALLNPPPSEDDDES